MVDCGYGTQKESKKGKNQIEESLKKEGGTEKSAPEEGRTKKEGRGEEAQSARKEPERGNGSLSNQRDWEQTRAANRAICRVCPDSAGADSESVDELLEEGNAFEAEVVEGVENVPDADQGEIKTHEVQEDDVPDEYLDKDQ